MVVRDAHALRAVFGHLNGEGVSLPSTGPAADSHGSLHGIFHTMITTIDPAGRLVIPAEIRREAAIEPGTPLDVRWRDGVIEIEPQPMPVSLERRGRLLVARPAKRVGRLRAATVLRTRRDLATRRG